MREFDSLVFMGAGERSGADCYRLHKILDRALDNLSALQQGAKADDIEDDIEEAAKDICAALLGRKIKLGDKLPYPGKLRYPTHSR
jgi:hypothetical protein